MDRLSDVIAQLTERQEGDCGCDQCFEHLEALVEADRATPLELAAPATHLSACRACRQDANALQELAGVHESPRGA